MNDLNKNTKESTPRFGTLNFEKRTHPRYSVNLPVEYWQTNDSKSHPARTGNISEGGLLLYIPEKIEIGQYLMIKLFFDSRPKLKTIEAKVQIVWKDFRVEEEDFYRVGVKFINIGQEALQELRNFLNTLKIDVPPRLLSTLGISILNDYTYLKPKAP